MLSVKQIERLVETESFALLIDRVLESGRSGCLPLRMRMQQAETAAPSALGLALQRVCELAYGPTPTAVTLAARLIHLQQSDGRFVGAISILDEECVASIRSVHDHEGPTSWIGTATALRGLLDFAQLAREVGRPADPRLEASIDRGLHALAAAQRPDGSIGSDPEENAVILWQLGGVPTFRRAVRYHDLIEAVELENDRTPLSKDLRRLALATAA